jgi:hypothetical protein
LSAVSAQLASARSEAAKAAGTEAAPERKKAASASANVDDLRQMLAAAMSDYVATTGLKEIRAQDKAQWQNRPGLPPAALLFQLPLALQPNVDAQSGKTEDKPRKAPPRIAPTAALPPKAINPPEPESTATVGTSRGAKEPMKPEAPKPSPRAGKEPVGKEPTGKEAAGKAERISARTETRSEPRRPSPARETVNSLPNARVLFLPPTLQPIDEEWEFE